ncbi:MAG: hypothetical protein JNL98_09360 [Bryobacterales bacterium]|nr:hypothetical protein [Bryobacterales bacterium]
MGKKQPKVLFSPTTSKQPIVAEAPERYYSHTPAWRLSQIQMVGPLGWHTLDRTSVMAIHGKLKSFESMTWREILLSAKKQHQSVDVARLSPEAQRQLEEIGYGDLDKIVSLRLSANGTH